MKRKFVRQNISRKRLEVKWRRPRGIHSKLRLNKAGHIKKPSPGFMARRKDRVKTALIRNINDLTNAKQSALLSSKLGLKKKLEILKMAQELKLKILNVKNIDEFIRKTNEIIEKKKQGKKKREIEKKKSKEKTTKEIEKKKVEEKPKPEEEQYKEDKQKDTQQKSDKQK